MIMILGYIDVLVVQEIMGGKYFSPKIHARSKKS